MRVVYQGAPGAFGEMAAEAVAPAAQAEGLPTFRAVFEAVAEGEAEAGVVPVENAIAGSVGAVLDLLFEFERLRVVGEHVAQVEPVLVGLPGSALEGVREVRSQPEALALAEPFLRQQLPQAAVVAAPDTAGAAREIGEGTLIGVAAIASRRAAERYGLDVLAEDIAADPRNVTRFLMLGREGPPEGLRLPAGPPKTSLVLLPNPAVPNALFRGLTAFVGRRLSVYHVQSRPRLGRPGEYRYYVDVEGDAAAEPLASALPDVQAMCDEVRVLGSYPAGSEG